MGNGYNHHLRHQNNHLHQKSTFLPMLCSRPAIKDVTVPKWDDRPMSISSADPLSPKIGCMGQVKRNNKIVGFPTPNKLTIATKKTSTANVSGAKIDDSKESSVSVSIENMDPPLPVVKRPTKDGEANSLWKRRSGGLGLKNLQLQEIQLNRSCLAPTTV
ncbi:hypothetical protein OIU78_012264 [Salix suchowensis]|nr:hypothetical protein OIU78_012264 [Salix suchowensis]